jgi:hypothetical protein
VHDLRYYHGQEHDGGDVRRARTSEVEGDTVDGHLVNGEEVVEGSGGTVQHAESVMEGWRAAAGIATDFGGESIEFAAKRKAWPLHLLGGQERGKVVCGGGGLAAEGRYRAS